MKRIRRYYEEIIDNSPELSSTDLHLGEKPEDPIDREVQSEIRVKFLEKILSQEKIV